jgi:UPF0716 protein FxsA
MAIFLVILFIAIPIVELYVIIQVGEAIGVLPTIALLILDSILGAMLLRSQSRAAWQRFNLALSAGRVPAREVFDGAMIILGGALLLTPGFVTDVFGLLLLLPPSRDIVRRISAALAKRRAGAHWRVAAWGAGKAGSAGRDRFGQRPPGGNGTPPPRPGRRSYDFEGTAREVNEQGELPPRQDG